jgi:hypothetical protein
VTCRLTIAGVTRSDVGECDLSDENAFTSAKAQAFKRACAAFGLGRYLYDLPKQWVEYDAQHRCITDAALTQLTNSLRQRAGQRSSATSGQSAAAPAVGGQPTPPAASAPPKQTAQAVAAQSASTPAGAPAVSAAAAVNTAAVIANLPAADAAAQKPAASHTTVTVHNAQTAADTAAKRPWGMAKLKTKLLAKAAHGKNHPSEVVVNGKYGAAIGLLDKACAGADHHILISEVFGVSQAKDLLPEQKWAIAEWAAPTKNDGTGLWALPATVLIEFRNLAQCAEGGTPMFE